MVSKATETIDSRGGVNIPEPHRRALGLRAGTRVELELREGGIFIRVQPEVGPEGELYTAERRAEFLLNSATTREEYEWARAESRRLGVDPDAIAHDPPAGA